MKLDDILSAAGKNKTRKRIGRGTGSGHGKTSGRGHKGYHSRAGSKRFAKFSGGSNPLLAKIPQRGFSNFQFRKEFQVVNIGALEAFENGAQLDAEALFKAGLIGDADKPVKILGTGELTKKLTIVASKFSVTAAEKIAKAGGSVQEA